MWHRSSSGSASHALLVRVRVSVSVRARARVGLGLGLALLETPIASARYDCSRVLPPSRRRRTWLG